MRPETEINVDFAGTAAIFGVEYGEYDVNEQLFFRIIICFLRSFFRWAESPKLGGFVYFEKK